LPDHAVSNVDHFNNGNATPRPTSKQRGVDPGRRTWTTGPADRRTHYGAPIDRSAPTYCTGFGGTYTNCRTTPENPGTDNEGDGTIQDEMAAEQPIDPYGDGQKEP